MLRQRLLACATAVFAPLAVAQSNVTIYGLFDAAVRHVDNAGTNRDKLQTMEDGIFTGTRLGFRGREDMGGGLLALFTLEAGFDPSAGTSLQASPTADYGQVASTTRFFGREAHVALRGGLGTVALGRQYTLAHTLAARFQPQGNPNNAALSLFSSHHVARQDNLARLDTKVGPVDLSATRTFGEQTTSSEANGAWAAGAGYSGGRFALAAYAQQMKNITGAETRKILGAGGNVKVTDGIQLYGGLMTRRHAVSAQRNRAWTLGANVVVAPLVTLSAAHYGDKQTGSTALAGKRTVNWITANYLFSKRTDVYAEIDRNEVDGGYAKPAFMGVKGVQKGFAVGLRHRY